MNKWLIFFLIFLFSLSLRLWNLNKIGRTWDEPEYIEQGYKLTELIKKRDFNNSYFYTTYDHPPLVKYLYGITAHFDVQKKLPNGKVVFNYDFTYSRILSAIFFSLGVAITFLIGRRIFSSLIGVISGVILSMLPFSLSLSQLVTAESFKIFIYPLVIYFYVLLIEKFSWKKVLMTGILIGISLQIKQSNFLLILILGFTYFFQRRFIKAKDEKYFFKNGIKALFYISIISVITFVLIWPQFIFHFKEVLAINDKLWNVRFSPKLWQLTYSPPEVFFGKLILTPIFYYVVYFFITIPVLILGNFFIGLRNLLKSKSIYSILMVLWLLIPFLLSFYSWRQHGLRYIIEIYPVLAIIASVGFEAILSRVRIGKIILISGLIIYLLLTIRSISPYTIDYFNELIGGVNNVYKQNLFQTGWWGEGLREAGLYLEKNAKSGSTVGLAISPDLSLIKFKKFNYFTWDKNKKYDYVIVNNYHIIRDGFDDSVIKLEYKPVYFVKADQAILATVYKLK